MIYDLATAAISLAKDSGAGRLIKQLSQTLGFNYVLGSANYPGSSYIDLVRNGYAKNPAVYAAVSLIARAAKTVPYYFVYVDWQGSETAFNDDRLNRLFRRPSPNVTFPFFLEQIFIDYLLYGNAFIYLLKTENSKNILEFARIRPDLISIDPSKKDGTPVSEYIFMSGSTRQTIPASNIIHWRNFDPLNDYFGISPLLAGFRSVILSNAAIDWNTAVSQNMGRISGIMKFDDMLTDEQYEQIYSAFRDRMSGASNAGTPIITDKSHTFIPTAMNPVDADWTNALTMTTQQIASVYGIDSGLIGDKTASTYNNQQQAILRLYFDRVIPMLNDLGELLNTMLIDQMYTGVSIKFNTESIEAIKKEQVDSFEKIDRISFLTVNEKRSEMGYEKIDDPSLDEIYLNSGLVPASDLSIDQSIMPGVE